MSLDTFFRNGPLVIAIMVTTETSQMKLDRPKTSVEQNNLKKKPMKLPHITSIFKNKQMLNYLLY